MEIFKICAHLENMLHHVVGLGTYRTYIGEAIKELRIYQQRLEYEDSRGYRNELDLMKDHAKDLEDENEILKEANERFRRELSLATKYVRETRTKLRMKRHDLYKAEDEIASLIEKLRKKELEVQALSNEYREELEAKDREIYELKLKRDQYSDSITYWKCKCHKLEKAQENNPSNFCGNCKYYAQMGKDNDEYEGICTQHYIKRVDPDDASCPCFQSNQVNRDKPDHPCCKACNRDDCDGCTLCPF